MSTPELVPRRPLAGTVGVWIGTAVAALGVSLFAPHEWRSAWITLLLGFAVIAAFAVQLAYGRTHGFIRWVSITSLGSLLILGVIAGLGAMATMMSAG